MLGPVPEDRLKLVGTTLEGKYRIDAVVAEGGFALLYRATHLVWERPVAVKAFYALADLPESSRENLVKEFVREGALLAELSERSAAIVQARDVGTLTTARGERVPYMILEWLDGATLESVLRSERRNDLPLRDAAETVALLDPIAEALALAHRKGIAHRDVKPPNIFVLGDARANATLKLLDFGIAKVVQDAQKMGGSFTKTSGNVTSFTPAYGAPEQFSRTHGATGPWTDVFALALVAVEVMTGKEPLGGDNFVQLGFASSDREHRPTPRALGANVSDAVEAVFAKALAVVPEQRHATAGEFWDDLRAALAMAPMRTIDTAPRPAGSTPHATASAFAATAVAPAPGTAPATTPGTLEPTMASREPPSSRAVSVVLAVLLLGGAGAGAYFFFHQPRGHRREGENHAARRASSSAERTRSERCPKGAVFVAGGDFFMGRNDGGEAEKPAHPVKLTPYCIDEFEVTVARYLACSNSGKCLRASTTNETTALMGATQHAAYDPVCNANEPKHVRHPINCVDWDQAERFCREAGGRLPTEAEWELAARGHDGRAYPWGDDPPGPMTGNSCGTECLAWAKKHGVLADFPHAMYEADDNWPTTAPVGSFPAGKSSFGVQDMVGNVAEWTSDWYAPYTKDVATTVVDPKGPPSGEGRVIRGGAWNAIDPAWANPTLRFHQPQTNRSHGTGFRCVYPIPSP